MQSLFFKSKPAFTEVDPYKLLINVGCLIDLPTGTIVRGQKGENITNGGLSIFTSVVGKGNTFKSTLMHYMMLAAANHMACSGVTPYLSTYDTEINTDLDRMLKFSQRFSAFANNDIIHDGIWSITDKTHHMGNEWYKILKTFLRDEKVKNKKAYTLETPFVDKDHKPVHAIFPTFGEVDSITEFETSDIGDIQDKHELGESGGNTIHMRSGLAKTRLLMDIPNICNSAGHYILMTAHIGNTIPMQQGPVSVPVKKLQHMKPGEHIKGVAEKFFFLPTAVWESRSASMLNNQTTKGPEYPRTREAVDAGSTDLNIVTIKMLRNKFGPSGFSLDIIVSQTEGVLASLTEFHFIKETGRWGLEGNNVNYSLSLYPGVNLTRTTVREKIDADPLLRRAIKISADLLQIKLFKPTIGIEIPTPGQLFEKLSKKYDWNTLLQTRDFWTFNNYTNPVPYLSTMDMVEMYHDKYHPYWASS